MFERELRWSMGSRYSLRGLHGFVIWCASYICKRSLWRDNNYELLKGGRLVSRRASGAVIWPD
jgi:hypothetical protein